MPLSIACPGCGARLSAPDAASGRTLRCPKCNGPVAVPSMTGPAADFSFAGPTGREYSGDEGNPFEDGGPAVEPQTDERESKKKGRRTTAKKKPGGYNPFEEGGAESDPTAGELPKKRRYRKDGDYNPFGDAEPEETPDPAGDGFEFGVETPPPAPAGDFDFGPLDPRGDDDGRRR